MLPALLSPPAFVAISWIFVPAEYRVGVLQRLASTSATVLGDAETQIDRHEAASRAGRVPNSARPVITKETA